MYSTMPMNHQRFIGAADLPMLLSSAVEEDRELQQQWAKFHFCAVTVYTKRRTREPWPSSKARGTSVQAAKQLPIPGSASQFAFGKDEFVLTKHAIRATQEPL